MSWGEIITAAGYGVGILIFLWEARRRKLATAGMRVVAWCGILGGVLGARITEWIFGGQLLLANQPGALFDPRSGGKSLIGGLLVGWLCVELAKRKLGITRSTGDLWALALPAGEAVGRIGCYWNGCCFGTPFTGAWAVYQHGALRHPTQFYSAASAAIISGLLWKWRDSLHQEGDLFRLYLLLYGASRLIIEFFRDRKYTWENLSTVQLICLETAIFAAVSLWLSHRKNQALITS